MRRICILLLIVFVSVYRLASAQDKRELEAKLEKIRLGVSEHEGEIARMRTEFNGLLKQRKELEGALQKLKQEEKGLLKKVEALSQERDALQQRVQAAEADVADQQLKITKRLRALYMSSSPHIARSYLWRAGGVDMERMAVYVRSVRTTDEGKFANVKAAVQALTDRRAELENVYKERKEVQGAATTARSNAEMQAAKLKGLGDQLSQKRKLAEASLAKLRKEAEKLESLMAAIMNADTEAPEVPGDEGPAPVTPESSSERKEDEASERVSSDGVVLPPKIELVPGGLFAAAARISAPVKGTVVQKFGKVKVTDFADMIFSKGLEFATAAGSDVFVVLAGKVAYVGNLPGYETVVVVDHGSRSYSLYGRLGKSLVKAGEMLAQDQAVGITGEPDSKGRNFYFEVRKSGSPVDPERVLRQLSR